MSEYIVSARKYRPVSWNQVVGQDSLTTTLKNAVRTGRLAHAYLFCGPRGVGKTTSARIFARTINCLQPTTDFEACGECESCRAFNEGRSFNIHELDAASNNSVEDIRQLTEQVQIPPQVGRYKVFIIDEVHMLSTAAFNAFLKTLEEPPAHVIFILATTEKHKILPTILSRCQTFDFNRMSVADTVRHLQMVAEQEGYAAEPEALAVIAQKADGGMRDALSIFDQVAGYTQGNITYQKVIENLNVLDYDYFFKMVDLLLDKKIAESMLLLDEVLSKGFDAGHFISGLATHIRNVMMSRDTQTLPLLQCSEQVRERYRQQAQRCKERFIYRALKLCNTCDVNYRASRNKRLLVEVTLVEVSGADDDAAGHRPAKILPYIFKSSEPVSIPPTPAVSGSVEGVQTVQSQTQPSAKTIATPDIAATNYDNSVSVQPANGVKSLSGISIRNKATTLEQQPPTPVVTNVHVPITKPIEPPVKETVELNENTLQELWSKYASALSKDETALKKKMQFIMPILGDNNCFEIVVGNAMVEADMKSHSQRIESYISHALGGTRVTMQVIVDEKNDTAISSPIQLLDYWTQKNDALMVLRERFELDLDY